MKGKYMDIKSILNTINKDNDQFIGYKEEITDKYLKNKEIPDVKGYGVYDAKAENRYCLCIDIQNNSNKSLTTLLMNPSNTFPTEIATMKGIKSRFDQTIRNLIRLAYKKGFAQVIVLNTFPFIEGNSAEANKYYKEHKSEVSFIHNQNINAKFIDTVFNNSTNLLVACGDNVNSELYSEYFEKIKKFKGKKQSKLTLYTYAQTKIKDNKGKDINPLTIKKRPRHLSLQSESNRTLYNRALQNNKLYELDIDIEKEHFILKS